MFPFIYIGDIEIRTHFILTLTGIIIGFLFLFYNIRNLDRKVKTSIILLALLIFIPFFVGGWMGYEIETFLNDKKICITKNSLFESFSLIWGLGFSTICAFLLAKMLKLNVWFVADIFSFSIFSGGFFVKLGCFFNGCCFGIPCPDNFPFGIYYPFNSYPQILFGDLRLFPSPLFESLAFLVVLFFIILRKKYKLFEGELIILSFFLFSILRFIIEFSRFHPITTFFSLGQIFSLIIFVISIIAYIYRYNNHKHNKKLDKT